MRQWAILVGLNNYQMFQPLNCAQQDAQALHQLLIHEVGLPPEQCLLFTDTSPSISGRSTTPTRTNLQSWIELLTQQCFKPGDTLWFFFSGYGVCSQGRDYLVPLDGDPFAVETTCILMSDIFSRLQSSVYPGLPLVLFDINRSQGNFSNENVGMQTARLAKQLAVPIILSCQPGQYSREISGLGHGLFALALMDALKYHQAATPATLMRFLGDRLPELGAYYYLPNQQPLSLCPSEQLHQPLIQAQFARAWNEDSNGNGNTNYATLAEASSDHLIGDRPSGAGGSTAIAEPHPSYGTDSTQRFSLSVSPAGSGAPSNTATHEVATRPVEGLEQSANINGQLFLADHAAPRLANEPPPIPVNSSNTQTYSSSTHLLIPPELKVPPAPPVTYQSPPVEPKDAPTPPPDVATEPVSSGALWQPILLWGGLLSLGLIGCVLWRNWTVIQTPSQTTSSANTVTPVPTSTLPAPTGTPSNSVETALTTPPEARETTPPPPDRALNFDPGLTPTAISGQAILENARNRVLSDQATPYRDAIDAAKQIQPNDPVYVTAQQDIAAWSQRILAIAQQRVTQKQWDIAIMAASLVPEDDRKLHPQAQALIIQTCPAIQDQAMTGFTMQKAKAICSQKPI